jgi:hypothetical protein
MTTLRCLAYIFFILSARSDMTRLDADIAYSFAVRREESVDRGLEMSTKMCDSCRYQKRFGLFIFLRYSWWMVVMHEKSRPIWVSEKLFEPELCHG